MEEWGGLALPSVGGKGTRARLAHSPQPRNILTHSGPPGAYLCKAVRYAMTPVPSLLPSPLLVRPDASLQSLEFHRKGKGCWPLHGSPSNRAA